MFLHLDQLRVGPGDALIVVDLQRDFLSGGSLAVPGSDQILPALARAVARFTSQRLPVFATRCWHPVHHCSFRERGGPWPVHCVRGTRGAELALELERRALIVSKGTDSERDVYSGFDHTDLEKRLHTVAAHHVFIGGVATEYCVFHTAKDALARGFAVSLLADAVRPIDRAGGERAIAELERLGAVPVAARPSGADVHVP